MKKNLNLGQVLVFGMTVAAVVSLPACGTSSQIISQFVQSVQVKTTASGSDVVGQFSAVLNTSNLQLPAFSVPLGSYGSLSVKTGVAGGSELDLNLDLTRITREAQMASALPNGMPIPIGGLGSSAIVGLAVGNTGAQAYAALGSGVALLGVAVPIAQFSQIGNLVGGANLFLPFNISGVSGVAGIYTGASGQNGIAFFVDLGPIASPSVKPLTVTSVKAAVSELGAGPASSSGNSASGAPLPSQVFFINTHPSSRKVNQIYRKLYEINRDGGPLSLQ